VSGISRKCRGRACLVPTRLQVCGGVAMRCLCRCSASVMCPSVARRYSVLEQFGPYAIRFLLQFVLSAVDIDVVVGLASCSRVRWSCPGESLMTGEVKGAKVYTRLPRIAEEPALTCILALSYRRSRHW